MWVIIGLLFVLSLIAISAAMQADIAMDEEAPKGPKVPISSKYMIHAADCHQDLLDCLDVAMGHIDLHLKDGTPLPEFSHHWFRHARRTLSRAKAVYEPGEAKK